MHAPNIRAFFNYLFVGKHFSTIVALLEKQWNCCKNVTEEMTAHFINFKQNIIKLATHKPHGSRWTLLLLFHIIIVLYIFKIFCKTKNALLWKTTWKVFGSCLLVFNLLCIEIPTAKLLHSFLFYCCSF